MIYSLGISHKYILKIAMPIHGISQARGCIKLIGWTVHLHLWICTHFTVKCPQSECNNSRTIDHISCHLYFNSRSIQWEGSGVKEARYKIIQNDRFSWKNPIRTYHYDDSKYTKMILGNQATFFATCIWKLHEVQFWPPNLRSYMMWSFHVWKPGIYS